MNLAGVILTTEEQTPPTIPNHQGITEKEMTTTESQRMIIAIQMQPNIESTTSIH